MTNDVLEEFTTLESQVLDYDDPVTHHDDDAEEEAEEVKIWAGLDQKKSNPKLSVKASMVLQRVNDRSSLEEELGLRGVGRRSNVTKGRTVKVAFCVWLICSLRRKKQWTSIIEDWRAKINEDKQKIRIQYFKLLNWTAVKIGKDFCRGLSCAACRCLQPLLTRCHSI